MERRFHIPTAVQIQGPVTEAERTRLEWAVLSALRRALQDVDVSPSEIVSAFNDGAALDPRELFSSVRFHPDRGTYSVPSYYEGSAPTEVPVEGGAPELRLTTLEEWLQDQRFDTSSLDWSLALPRLLSRWPGPPIETAQDLSDYYRYQMFLHMLASEVQGSEPVEEAAPTDIELLESHILQYLLEVPPKAFPEETLRVYSKAFLLEWLEAIREIRYVPEGFDPTAFRPESTEEELADERRRIISDFIDTEAPGLMTMFALDQWVGSRQSPEEWLADLNLDDYRAELVVHLADRFMECAKKDPEYARALRVAAVEQSAYDMVAGIYNWGKSIERVNADLYDELPRTPIADALTGPNRSVVNDPHSYLRLSQSIADKTREFLGRIRPGGRIALALVDWVQGILSDVELPQEYVGLIALGTLSAPLRKLKELLKEEEETARRQIAREIWESQRYEEVAAVVCNYIEHAERFIREDWIPTLKDIAKEKLKRNRDELQQVLHNWDIANWEFIQRLKEGANEFDRLALALEEGQYESIELEGQLITAEDAEQLRNAALLMRTEAEARQDPEWSEGKKEQLDEAVRKFEEVKKDIEGDQYDLLYYSAPVYDEARQRLGISEFPEFTTVGEVLMGEVVAEENPFLAWAITRWRWKEGTDEIIETGLLLGVLGIVTVAAMIVTGGIAGLVLTVLDIGIAVGMGIKGIADAKEMLNMAQLDTRGDIRGISVKDAERALTHAWINLGITVVLTFGIGALMAAFKRKGGRMPLPPPTGKGAPAGRPKVRRITWQDLVEWEQLELETKELPRFTRGTAPGEQLTREEWGHLLERHVFITDDALRSRAHTTSEKIATKFNDPETAVHAINQVIEREASSLEAFLARLSPGEIEHLPLRVTLSQPVGYGYRVVGGSLQRLDNLCTVKVWVVSDGVGGWIVRTAHPGPMP